MLRPQGSSYDGGFLIGIYMVLTMLDIVVFNVEHGQSIFSPVITTSMIISRKTVFLLLFCA
jgi:hypothetical protein